jgi:hypothetical protein
MQPQWGLRTKAALPSHTLPLTNTQGEFVVGTTKARELDKIQYPSDQKAVWKKDIYDKYGTYSLEYKIASDYDMMVRLFYKHKIRTKYLPLTFVTMRLGGVSTKNVSNRWLITREDIKACKQNGLYTNIIFICVKYLLKIFEFRYKKIKSN